MDVAHTFPDVRYWSEGLCCTIPINLQVKVRDLEKQYFKFLVKVFYDEQCFPVTTLI